VPELPDVEMARRDLQRWLAGAMVTAADCIDAYVARPASPRLFARTLVGRVVRTVERKGKWLRIVLDDGGRLFSHLGMTGDWRRVAPDAPTQRLERARIDVVRGGRASSVRYTDARRFGRLIAAEEDIPDWSALGRDPLADGIDAGLLARALGKGRRPVKAMLLDQGILAGVGNILATEALWMARVDPRSPGRALLPGEVRAIGRGIGRAIARELADRRRGKEYAGGRASFFVYGRAGKPCPRCGTRLTDLKVAGRTTVVCRSCQAPRRDAGSVKSAPRRRGPRRPRRSVNGLGRGARR
jgi:formamidopyrimidine-DNA glycosylase